MNPIYAPVFRSGMLSVMSKRNDSAERWREILRRQESSGLSVAAFYYWRRKLQESESFAEVWVAPDAEPAAGIPSNPVTDALALVLSRGHHLVVRPGFDRGTLLALLDALERRTGNGDASEPSA